MLQTLKQARCPMRSSLYRLIPLLVLLPMTMTCDAAGFGVKPSDVLTDPTLLIQLESQAEHADPREQAFLYTQVVQVMTDLAGHELADGNTEKAATMLAQMEHYADLIHGALARNTRKLREAEMMMHATTRRLGEFLHASTVDDTASMQATLKKLDKVHDELLTQVFQH